MLALFIDNSMLDDLHLLLERLLKALPLRLVIVKKMPM